MEANTYMTMKRRPIKRKRVAPPPEIQALLDSGRLDAIEEDWLARLEGGKLLLDYFIPVALALDEAGADGTARSLLELLDDQLVAESRWKKRLRLLRRCGKHYVKQGRMHHTILETLEGLYGHLPSYQDFIEKIGLERAPDDLPKTWKKVDRFLTLAEFDIGSIVLVESKGAGRVVEVNMTLDNFKIKLDDLELRVGFGGAAKLLKALPEDHLLYLRMTERGRLAELATADPPALLRMALESYDEPRTGADIKRDIVGIIPESQWNRFWTAARKHPQVLASTSGKRTYSWMKSSAHAQDVVWQSFENADPRSRIDLLRRDGSRDETLKQQMAETLVSDAQVTVSSDPGLVCEIYFALEREKMAPTDVSWAPDRLIAESPNPRALLGGIKDRGWRERCYEIARKGREDWIDLYVELLAQEEDPRSLDLLAKALEDKAPPRLESFFDQLLSQARKTPAAFTWFAERASERAEWLGRNPLRLMQQLLWAMTSDEFASLRAARLVPLCDSGGTLPRLLDHLDVGQAEQALAVIAKTPGLEEYQRDPLLNAIQLRFPELRKEEEAPLYATLGSISTKKAELKRLAEEEIPANRKAIEEAREMGDLRENFEYKAARQRHEYLTAIAGKLQTDLRRVRPIDPSQVSGKEVAIGCQVRLTSETGERQITILGPWESEPEKEILSNESEQAMLLLGRRVDDTVELGGETYRVVEIGAWGGKT